MAATLQNKSKCLRKLHWILGLRQIYFVDQCNSYNKYLISSMLDCLNTKILSISYISIFFPSWRSVASTRRWNPSISCIESKKVIKSSVSHCLLQIVKLGNEAANVISVSSKDVGSSKMKRYEVMILYQKAASKHKIYNFLDVFMVIDSTKDCAKAKFNKLLDHYTKVQNYNACQFRSPFT